MINNTDQVGSTTEDDIMNVEGDDRLSRLSDDLIYKILSFVSIKDAIGTNFLSSRWRSIWTSIPYLNLSPEYFSPRCGFSKFFLNVLSRLNKQIQVSSVKLIHRDIVPHHNSVKKAVKYAVSLNVQQLTVTCFLGLTEFPLSVFNSKSLEHLTFGGYFDASRCDVSPTWELPALTTLHLHLITFSDQEHHTTDKFFGLFSKCTNLKNLLLSRCKIKGTNVFNIFHPTLSNLTLDYTFVEVINVVTPQLKNLTIGYCYGMHMITAPELTSFVFKGYSALHHSAEGFPFLEKLHLVAPAPTLANARKTVCLLQQIHTVRFLTLNLEYLKLLCSSTELISHQPCAFPNLKISKFSTNDAGMVYLEVETQEEVTMITELENHDTSSSTSTIFTLVSWEEIEAMSKLVLAQQLIEELRELLKMCARNSHQITGCKRKTDEQVKQSLQSAYEIQSAYEMQSAFEMQWHFGEMMAQIEQGILDGWLTKELPALNTRHMISMLQCIEGLVTELPASKRPALQVMFSRICEEAAILMNNIMEGMKKPVISRSSSSRKPKLNQDPSLFMNKLNIS